MKKDTKLIITRVILPLVAVAAIAFAIIFISNIFSRDSNKRTYEDGCAITIDSNFKLVYNDYTGNWAIQNNTPMRMTYYMIGGCMYWRHGPINGGTDTMIKTYFGKGDIRESMSPYTNYGVFRDSRKCQCRL